MEQGTLSNEQYEAITKGIADGQKQIGSKVSDSEIQRVRAITEKLKDISIYAPFYSDIQFLLAFSNKQIRNVRTLENKCSELAFEIIKQNITLTERKNVALGRSPLQINSARIKA